MTDQVSPHNENHIQPLIVYLRGQKAILDIDPPAPPKAPARKRIGFTVKEKLAAYKTQKKIQVCPRQKENQRDRQH
jgi:hypothetical protein